MIAQSRVSVPAVFVLVENWNDGDGHPAGAFTIELEEGGGRVMLYNCPSDGPEGLLRLRPAKGSPSWSFNDNVACPTLTPSVHRQKRGANGELRGTIWHGFLTAGEWCSC